MSMAYEAELDVQRCSLGDGLGVVRAPEVGAVPPDPRLEAAPPGGRFARAGALVVDPDPSEGAAAPGPGRTRLPPPGHAVARNERRRPCLPPDPPLVVAVAAPQRPQGTRSRLNATTQSSRGSRALGITAPLTTTRSGGAVWARAMARRMAARGMQSLRWGALRWAMRRPFGWGGDWPWARRR